MNDHYAVLSLSHDAGAAEIRSRYLELVRQFPPERHPEQAARIRAAYDALRDPAVRLEKQLFQLDADVTLAGIIESCQSDVRSVRLPVELLLSLGK